MLSLVLYICGAGVAAGILAWAVVTPPRPPRFRPLRRWDEPERYRYRTEALREHDWPRWR